MSEVKDFLFSRAIKAGRRVYYLDVKNDKNGEYYLAITESKKVKEGNEYERPVFEKHKIFLYREDLLKFNEVFQQAMGYIEENAGLETREERRQQEAAENAAQPAEEPLVTESLQDTDFNIDIEF